MAIAETLTGRGSAVRRNIRLTSLLSFLGVSARKRNRPRITNLSITHADPMKRATLKASRSDVTVHIIAVSHKRYGELRVFVQSLLNQTCPNWTLTVVHDGPDEEFCRIMCEFRSLAPSQISYETTENRYADYGHSLRQAGLAEARGDYVLLTNADNYFVPRAIEFLSEVVDEFEPDVVMFDMIHSHHRPGKRKQPSYSFFETDYKRHSIDVSAAIVRKDLAQKAGFRDKGYAGDATYFEDVAAARAPDLLRVAKLPRVLFVHN